MTHRITRCLLTFVLASSLSPVLADCAEQNRFSPAHIFDLEYGHDPRISPDGEQVIYLRQSFDIMTDRRIDNLWFVNTDGSDHRPLVAGRFTVGSPRWSPSGDRVAYVSTESGMPQIFVRWMDTGQSAAISSVQKGPSNLAWSPDGTRIAFTMSAPAESPGTPAVASGGGYVQPPQGATWAKPFQLVTRNDYRANGVNLLPDEYSHIYVVPADGGTARKLTSGDFHHAGALSWDPDSKSVVFAANRSEDAWRNPYGSEIYRLNVADGSLEQLTDREGPDMAPVVSPAGDLIAYVGFDERGMTAHSTELYVMDDDGGNPRRIDTGFDGSISSPVWSPDGRGLYVYYQSRGVAKLGYVALDGGSMSEIASGLAGAGINRSFALPPGHTLSDDGVFATAVGDGVQPADIVAGRLGGGLRRLTRLNDDALGLLELSPYSELTWKSSADGQEIHGFYAAPPDFDPKKKYPLVLEIHGGPQMAWGPFFSPLVQSLTAKGYVVLMPNPRGSTSYGAAFRDEIDRNYPSEDYDDLMSGVDAMIDLGFIDSDQLYITGLSGGGVLSSWSIGKTDRFRAAFVRGPVINFSSMVLTSTMNVPGFMDAFFNGTPWENPEHYWKHSPLSLVGNVTTPTLLMTGDADYQTAISEAEQYYAALLYEGVETQLVRVPDAGHVFFRPSQMMTELDYMLGWFEKYREN
jgi:dipeptidyl aminopeptidase/acylaminoacyl peptidase